ncbi:MAG: hypothetical protein RLY31_2999 [Bacteroidota bacterium]
MAFYEQGQLVQAEKYYLAELEILLDRQERFFVAACYSALTKI